MLTNEGVEVNALSCITDYSSKKPSEIYNFLKQTGFKWMQFIPILEPDKKDSTKAASFSVSGKDYGSFLTAIFDLWVKDYQKGINPTSVRHIESSFYRYVGIDSPECTLKKECGIYLVIEHNGDVFACDFFVKPEWKLGNIHNGNLIDMLNSEKMNEFGKIKSIMHKKCNKCRWLNYCYGGCPKDRINDPLDKGQNHFCESYQTFLSYADPILTQLAKTWRDQQINKSFTYNASDHFNSN
jgi:uncharacterized protein